MQLSSKARKAVAAGLTASTMLWASVMGLAPIAASAAVHTEGCVVLSGGVVWLITGGTRRGFTSAEVFASHGYNFSQVVSATSEDAALPVGPIMTYADGTLVKGPNDPLVYLVANGQKRGFTSGSVFTGLGYSFANIQQAPVNTFSDLPTGSNLDSAAVAHPAGTLVISNGAVWKMTATGRMGFPSAAVFNSYGYSWGKVVAANSYDLAMADQGAVSARPACTTTGEPPVSGSMSVSLAASSPAAGTVIAGQALADLAHFYFNGTGTVTNLKLKRTGVSADTTLSAVYLYEGNVRLTDSATVSSGIITFNNPAGLFSGPKTISVRSNIAASTSGQTVGVMVDSVTLSSGTATGTPAGANHTVATLPSTFATVDFNATTTPAAATITAQDDYTMWQNTVSIGNNPVTLKSFRLRQIGSVNTTDLANFELYVDGVKVGSTVSALSADGYVTFDLGNGVNLNTGSRIIKMLGDIIGGANRNFQFSLRQAADGMFIDQQFNQAVLATANGSTFSARETGAQTVDTGTLTITKRTDSPTGNIVKDASNAVIGRFDVKAAGEGMKVESLRVSIVAADADSSGTTFTAYTLRNGALYVDGVQVGSTTAINEDSDSTAAYAEFTFGSSFIVNAGQTRVLEVRGDIYDNDGTNDVDADDTLKVRVENGSSNVQRLTSLGTVSVPAADVDGNTLTIKTGSLTLAKNTSYGDHTSVAPKTAYKLGSFTVTAATTEAVNITNVDVDWTTAGDADDASDDLTNLYVVMGSLTTPIKATVTDTDNNFATNFTLNAGQTVSIDVYATVASSITDGAGTADSTKASVTLTGTAASGTAANAASTDGQTVTWGTGTFTTSFEGNPLNRIVAGNQEVEAAKFNFQAQNETYTVKEIQVKVASATVASVVSEARIYDGSTLLGSAPMAQATNTAALVTGLNVAVSANTTKTLTVKLLLNQIGTGAGTSQSNATVTLDSVKIMDSQGVEDSTSSAVTTDRTSNELYVYKSIPTATHVDLTNSTVVNGEARDLYKFTVSASSQGSVDIKQFKLSVTWSDGGTTDTMEVESLKFYEDGQDITSSVALVDEDGNDVEGTSGLLEDDGTLVVAWNSTLASTISAGGSKTFTVRGTPQGFRATGADTVGDTVSMYLAGDAAHNGTSIYLNDETDIAAGQSEIWELFTSAAANTSNGTAANFIWSDVSSNAHVKDANASSSGDWANGYKVLNLDLPGESWTK